jgi:hypothetical protein
MLMSSVERVEKGGQIFAGATIRRDTKGPASTRPSLLGDALRRLALSFPPEEPHVCRH